MIHLDFSTFPVLDTERLLLRALQPTDVNEIFALRSDDNINKYINRAKAQTIEDAEQFIVRIQKSVANNETLLWAIELKDEKKFVGTFLLWNINVEKNEAEIGYELLSQYHGKRIIQEAIQTVLKFAFDTLKIKTIIAIAHKENIASIKILLQNNFKEKKEIEENVMEYILQSSSKDFLYKDQK